MIILNPKMIMGLLKPDPKCQQLNTFTPGNGCKIPKRDRERDIVYGKTENNMKGIGNKINPKDKEE